MLRVIHILPYEKYVSDAIRIWKSMHVVNSFVSLDKPNDKTICELADCIDAVASDELVKMLRERGNYDIVVFHSLPTNLYDFVLRIPDDKIIIWQIVGYDVYCEDYPYRSLIPIDLFKPITNAYINKPIVSKTIYEKIRHIIALTIMPWRLCKNCKQRHEIRRTENVYRRRQERVWERMDYISTVLASEYELIRKNPHVRAKHFGFQYIAPFEVAYGSYIIDFEKTKYLQIGNSGDPANNHLDVIDLIKNRQIDSELFIPIAYGGSDAYKNEIEKSIQNDKCYIQRDYVNKSLYFETLHMCRAAVFGHLRQQALMNVYVLLMQGSKIFFYKDSITYKYLKQIGVFVFSIEDDLTQETIDTPLTFEQIMHNRSLFANQYYDVISLMRSELSNMEKQFKNENMD